MKVKLKSKRVLKRMLSSGNYDTACIQPDTILRLQKVGLVKSKYHSSGFGYYRVPEKRHTSVDEALAVPKHFIGKVVRK